MATFIPPTDNIVVGIGHPLLRKLTPMPRGRNVYLKTDGTFTESQPPDDDINIVYHGGHQHTITATESAALTTAGYGNYIT
jgi:hypothetical protein